MSYQIDLLPQEQKTLHQFLSIALGGNSYLHPYIEDCYQKNQWEFFEAYQNSDSYRSSLFSMYTTKSEEKIRQVAGIIEWCYQHQQFFYINHLIKKGYKLAYQYVQQRAVVDFDHFMRYFAKRNKSKIVKEIELLHQNIIVWYLCVRDNIPFNTDNIAWQSFQEVLQSSIKELKLQQVIFSKDTVEQHKVEIEELYQEYHIPKNPKFDSLGVFLEYLISDNLKRIYEENPFLNAETAENRVFQDTLAKYIGALGGWLKTLHIHELDATEQIPLTKNDLDMVFLELLYAKKYNYISKEEQDLFFITCLYLKCLGSHFRETKQLYLDHSKQEYYIEMKSKETRIRQQEAALLRRQEERQQVQKKKEQEINNLVHELHNANTIIRQLEQQIERMENYKDEADALRNFVYVEEKEEQFSDKVPALEERVAFIKTKRMMIFGGSTNWRIKMKEVLPTIEFLDVVDKNRDITKIHRVDAVFINTSFFSHSFYKRIMKELNKCETPLYYLNGHSNVNKSVAEIYNWLIE